MAQNVPQSYSNHARFHPLYHFFLTPLFFAYLVWTVIELYRRPGLATGFDVLLAVALIILVLLTRLYSLKVQDRVIRLEERLRLVPLLDQAARQRLDEVRPDQFVALRFASDDDAPQLVERILAGELDSPKEIKQAIRTWRPDHFRV